MTTLLPAAAASSYSIITPHRIVFGPSAAGKLPGLLPDGARRVLFAAGNHAVRSGDADRLQQSLENSGRAVEPVSGIAAEPPLADVDRLIEAGRSFRADAVIALGGGSVMDAAKAAAALIPAGGSCADYFSGGRTIDRKGLFFAALPTTAGTGAEMTSNAVLTDPVSCDKKSLRSPYMTPDLALIDPDFTISCPAAVTAASGMDALVQAIEAFTSPKASVFSRALAKTAFAELFAALPDAVHAPGPANRAAMAEGSMLTGIAFAQSGLGAVHGIAHPAGSLLHIPHGVACAVILPHVLDFNRPVCGPLYAELAQSVGQSGADGLLESLRELADGIAIPRTLSGYGLRPEHFSFIVDHCRSGSMNANPRFMPDDDVRRILASLSEPC